MNFSRGSQRDKKEEEKGRTSEFSTLFMKQKAPPLPPFSARFSENCYGGRFGRVWRGPYSLALGGFWWSRTLRGLKNVLV